MPFPYPSSNLSGRPRRREKDGRITISRSSSRKHKDVTRSSNRSPSHHPQAPTNSIYIQKNTTLDNLPEQLPLPESESGTVSPSSTISFDFPLNRTTSSENTSSETNSISPPKLPRLPAALQPYLEEDLDDVTPIQTSKGLPTEPERFNPSSYFPPHGSRPVQTKLESKRGIRQDHPADSVTKSIPEPNSHETERTPNRKTSPAPLHQILGSCDINSPQQVAHQWAAAGSVRPHSPPQPSSCSWFEPRPLSGSLQINQPYLYNSNYVPSSQSLIHPHPYRSGFPSEQFIAPPYGGPQFMHMAQPNGLPMDPNMTLPQQSPFFPGYGFPQVTQLQPQSMRSPPVHGYGVLSPRGSISGDAFQGPPISTANDSEGVQSLEGQGHLSHEEEDAVNLLHRIQIAIPDLHQLVHKYRETSGRLGAKEDHIRQTEAEKAELLKQREVDIDRLRKELEAMTGKHGAESSKLRLEIGNLEEKHKELQDGLVAKKRSRDQLEATNRELKLLQEELEERLRIDREAMTREFSEWKSKVTDECMMKQKALEEELQCRLRESEASLSTLQIQINDSNKARAHEKEALSSGFSQTRRELEDSHTKIRKGLEVALETRQKELEGAHMRHLDSQAAWEKERTTMKRGWDEERSVIEKGWEEQRRKLHLQHKNEVDGMQKAHNGLQARCETLEDDNTKLQKEIQRLRGGWDDDKIRFVKAKDQLSSTSQMLNRDNEKLQKMVEAFGEATDFRSRGDAYFVHAFSSLRKQISDLADDHFVTAIEIPPNSIMDKVPESFPDFLSNTESANQLRALYVQHIISRMLYERIFEPFLFTLPWRLKDADLLFKEMSQKTRRKSIRREAVWRQHTLHAAYTASSAKQTINKIAAIIVDDIVDEIKYFANISSWEQVTVGIRRIVKLAAETWRYARLEREMITASFPPAIPPLIDYVDENAFGILTTQGQQREVLLSLLPMIEREPVHECHRTPANVDDQGHIYSLGTFLSSDDPAVLARLAELRREHVLTEKPPEPDEQATQRHLASPSNGRGKVRSSKEPTIRSQIRSLQESGGSTQVPPQTSHRKGKVEALDTSEMVEPYGKEEEKISTQYGSISSNSQSSANTSMDQPSSSSYDTPTEEVLPRWGNSS